MKENQPEKVAEKGEYRTPNVFEHNFHGFVFNILLLWVEREYLKNLSLRKYTLSHCIHKIC